jgi:flavin-binding protein dodecin
MSVAKVVELSAESSKSFEAAIQEGVNRASDTLENVTGAWVKEQQVRVEGGKITGYRVHLQVTFVLK